MDEIFEDIIIDFGVQNLLTIGERVMQIAHQRRLPNRPWSLAELGLTELHHQRFRAWLQFYQPQQLDEILHSNQSVHFQKKIIRPREVFGFFLLLHFADIARREASEGSLWPEIIENFPVAIRPVFFTENGYLRQETGNLLKKTVTLFNIRNAFHQTRIQAFYRTIFLQFGFSKPMIENRLKYWISGVVPPEFVLELINDSPDFGRLWQKLKLFHLNELKESDVREELLNTPWFLPEWVDLVLNQAKERISQHTTDLRNETLVETQNFKLGMIRSTNWINGIIDLYPSFFDGLSNGLYDIRIGQTYFQFNTSQGNLRLQFPLENLNTEVEFTHSETPDQPNSVWFSYLADGLDFAFFNCSNNLEVSGDTANAFPTNHAYLLLTKSDIRVEPCFQPLPHPWGLDYKLYLVPSPSIAAIQLFSADDELLWRYPTQQEKEIEQDLVELKNFRLSDKKLSFRIKIASDRRLLSLRVGNFALSIDQVEENNDGNTYETVFECPVELFLQKKLVLKLRLEKNLSDGNVMSYVKYIKLGNPFEGAALKHNQKWFFPSPDETIFTASNDFFELNYRSLDPKPTSYVFDGSKCLQKIKGRMVNTKLKQLLCCGELLTLRDTDIHSDLTCLKPLARFVDNGMVEDTSIDKETQNLIIEIKKPLQVTSEYGLVYINDNGSIAQKSFDPRPDASKSLAIPINQPPLLGFSFKNTRIGAWWSDDWKIIIEEKLVTKNAANIAAFLRWLKFPVLGHLSFFQNIASHFSWQFLLAWGTDLNQFNRRFEPLQIESGPEEQTWQVVLRHTFSAFSWSEELLPEDCFDNHENFHDCLVFINDLGRKAPVVAGQLLHIILQKAIKDESLKPLIEDELVAMLNSCLRIDGAGNNLNQHQINAFKQLSGPEGIVPEEFLEKFIINGLNAFKNSLAQNDEEASSQNHLFEFAQENSSSYRALLWLRIILEIKEEFHESD